MKFFAYQWILFPLSLFVGIPFALGMLIAKRFVGYEPFSWEGIPENAILYSTHPDVYAICWNPQFTTRASHAFVIGFHGLTPYLWIPHHKIVGIEWEIYSKFSSEKNSDQILNHLKRRRSERLWLLTDAGGPYGTVRPSLIKLARESGRPLVAFRHQISKYVVILQHRIPLPGSRMSVRFSPVISVEELKQSADPTKLIQQRFDDVSS